MKKYFLVILFSITVVISLPVRAEYMPQNNQSMMSLKTDSLSNSNARCPDGQHVHAIDLGCSSAGCSGRIYCS